MTELSPIQHGKNFTVRDMKWKILKRNMRNKKVIHMLYWTIESIFKYSPKIVVTSVITTWTVANNKNNCHRKATDLTPRMRLQSTQGIFLSFRRHYSVECLTTKAPVCIAHTVLLKTMIFRRMWDKQKRHFSYVW